MNAAPAFAKGDVHLLRWLSKHFEEYFVVLLMAVMTLFICGQVFTRYILETAMSWTEEISRYMFIWLVYVGISYGVKKAETHKCGCNSQFFAFETGTIFCFFGDILF